MSPANCGSIGSALIVNQEVASMRYEITWKGSAYSYKSIESTEHIDASSPLEALESAKPRIISHLLKGGRPFSLSKLGISDGKGNATGVGLEQITRVSAEITSRDGWQKSCLIRLLGARTSYLSTWLSFAAAAICTNSSLEKPRTPRRRPS